jgi:hypothetical protein
MVEKDLDSALALTDFPCLIAGARGVRSVDREEFEKIFRGPREEIADFAMSERPEVRLLNPETAVVAYSVRTTTRADGKSRGSTAFDASTWVKRGNEWRCAMHTETEAKSADRT